MPTYKSDIQKALEGVTITAVGVDSDGEHITFTIEGQPPVVLETEGDCCSYTWIESLDAPDALIGTVQSVEDIAMPDLGSIGTEKHTGVNCVAYYGLKIITNKGICVIDYRNDSNGYYGGSLRVVKRAD